MASGGEWQQLLSFVDKMYNIPIPNYEEYSRLSYSVDDEFNSPNSPGDRILQRYPNDSKRKAEVNQLWRTAQRALDDRVPKHWQQQWLEEIDEPALYKPYQPPLLLRAASRKLADQYYYYY
jgi:hypothetical protein